MKTQIILSLSTLILFSCKQELQGANFSPIVPASVSNNNPTTNQIYDLDFYRYVFAQRMGLPTSVTNGISVMMDASLNGTTTIGVCAQSGNERRVTLNPSFWNNVNTSNEDREQLIMHEFGHCYLGRGHLSDSVPSMEVPTQPIRVSIMNPYFLDTTVYKANWKKYMYEFKNPGQYSLEYYLIPDRNALTKPYSEWDGTLFSAYFANLTGNSTMNSNALRTYNLTSNVVIDPFGNKVKLVHDDRYNDITQLDCD